MLTEEGSYKNEGYRLIGAAIEVYKEHRGGLLEEVYQESFEIELALRGIPFRSKQKLAVYYKGRLLQKCYIPDLYVFGGIVVELKAVSHLAPEHEAQMFNYMRLARQPVGYLLNFANLDELEWRRFVLSELASVSAH